MRSSVIIVDSERPNSSSFLRKYSPVFRTLFVVLFCPERLPRFWLCNFYFHSLLRVTTHLTFIAQEV